MTTGVIYANGTANCRCLAGASRGLWRLTVYRRPDPIPLRRTAPVAAPGPLATVRAETEDLNRLAAREIFQAIASGRFAPGAILPNEFELAASLGVSRTALREAIRGLVAKGIVETRRKRGTQVLDRSHWNMLDPEVITWSRREGGRRVSPDLWDALVVAQAATAADVARTGHATTIADALHRFASATGAEERRNAFCQVLLDLAALGNRYLRSLTIACVRSLLQDDPGFLDEQIDRMPSAALHDLVDAIRGRRPSQAHTAARIAFGALETAPAVQERSAAV